MSCAWPFYSRVFTYSEETGIWSSSPLIVSQDSFRPEVASWRAEKSLIWRMSLDTFDIPSAKSWWYIISRICLWIPFYYLRWLCTGFLLPLRFVRCWSSVFIRRIICKFWNVCPFDYTGDAESGNVGPVNRLTTQVGWPIIQTDRPKSVRNLYVIELLWRCLCCHFALLTFLLV